MILYTKFTLPVGIVTLVCIYNSQKLSEYIPLSFAFKNPSY